MGWGGIGEVGGMSEVGNWLVRVVEMSVGQKRVEVEVENEGLATAQLRIMGS